MRESNSFINDPNEELAELIKDVFKDAESPVDCVRCVAAGVKFWFKDDVDRPNIIGFQYDSALNIKELFLPECNQGKKYFTKLLSRLIDFCLRNGLNRIVCCTLINKRLANHLSKIGFTLITDFTGEFREFGYYSNPSFILDLNVYKLMNDYNFELGTNPKGDWREWNYYFKHGDYFYGNIYFLNRLGDYKLALSVPEVTTSRITYLRDEGEVKSVNRYVYVVNDLNNLTNFEVSYKKMIEVSENLRVDRENEFSLTCDNEPRVKELNSIRFILENDLAYGFRTVVVYEVESELNSSEAISKFSNLIDEAKTYFNRIYLVG